MIKHRQNYCYLASTLSVLRHLFPSMRPGIIARNIRSAVWRNRQRGTVLRQMARWTHRAHPLCRILPPTRRTISPGAGHVHDMIERFNAQPPIIDNASAQQDAPAREPEISPKIKALQDKLAMNVNQNKPLGGGIRQR